MGMAAAGKRERGRKDGERAGAREIRRAWREERGRNQRRERSARRETYLLALANAFARAAIRSLCRRALPCSPSARGAAAGGLLFPRRLLWSSIE
jgi:hypothetical protein